MSLQRSKHTGRTKDKDLCIRLKREKEEKQTGGRRKIEKEKEDTLQIQRKGRQGERHGRTKTDKSETELYRMIDRLTDNRRNKLIDKQNQRNGDIESNNEEETWIHGNKRTQMKYIYVNLLGVKVFADAVLVTWN